MTDYSLTAIFGPTAIGKTAVAIELSKLLREQEKDPIVVSADALQVYRGLETLTGAATEQERAELEHRLISFVPLNKTFSAGEYAKLAHAEIDRLLGEERVPIVVGGTGLYLRAALTELNFQPAGGDESNQLWSDETRLPTLLIGLICERAELYERVNRRVDKIVAAGAETEVRSAEAAGISATARKALGFRELLDGDIESMKLHTRQYARRQLTWMRKMAGVQTIDVTELSAGQVATEIHSLLR